MGGVDLYDGHYDNVLPSIRSKKWTRVIFIRFIQTSITNSLLIFNTAKDRKEKAGIKEFTIFIAKYCIQKDQKKRKKPHKKSRIHTLKTCSYCPIKTRILCKKCNLRF